MKIKKEELSVFKFTNELTEELKTQLDKDLDCLISCKRHLMDLAEKERNKKNKKDDASFNKLFDSIKNLRHAIDRCINKYPILFFTDGPGQTKMRSAIKNTFKRSLSDDVSTYNKILLVDQCLNMLQTIIYGTIIRGDTIKSSFNVGLSKLLLISENAYLNAKCDKALAKNTADFSQLVRLMPKDVSFEIFVKGKLRESRLAFHVSKKLMHDKITLTIWDRCFGIFTFIVEDLAKSHQGSENSYTLAPAINCLCRKDGNWCAKSLDCKKSNCCVERFCDCSDGRIQMAYAVLMCVQEYLVRKEEVNLKRALAKLDSDSVNVKDNNKDNKDSTYAAPAELNKVDKFSDKTEKLRIDGTITVHNYGNVNSGTGGNSNGSGGNNFGIQKCPHVRSGYWRTYKSGKKVYVKSCVVHKDKYRGYNSADQL